MQLKYDIAVIGGGPCGIMAGIAAARELKKNNKDIKIAVIEKNTRVGKKLLATGNGRCNLTNINAGRNHYHGDTEFLSSFLSVYTPKVIIEYFKFLGLLCKEQDEGRVYPNNFQAAAVLDILRFQLENLKVHTICDFDVTRIEKISSGFKIFSTTGSISSKLVICAFGGMAYPQLGSNGSGFEILKTLGHSTSKLFPALVQVKTDPKRAKPLKGARSAAKVTLFSDGKPIKTVNGEVQFTEKGLSGICIFELSRLVGELNKKHKIEISLDLLPEYSSRQILSMLRHTRKAIKNIPSTKILCGCINKIVGSEIVRFSIKNVPEFAYQLNPGELAAIANTVKDFRFGINGTLGFKDAQITAGGVPLKEVDKNMQSKYCPGLYLAGELLNIDGDCGGYNLHWAWSSGILAGHAAALSLLKK